MRSYELKLFKGLSITIDSDFMACLAFVLFFGEASIRVIIGKALFFIHTDVITWIMIVLMYGALVLSLWMSGWERVRQIKDALVLYAFMAIFFEVTLLIHPEYKWWYFESSYPVLSWIFRPNQYMYAYLFVRLVKDPKQILRMLKIVTGLLLLYYTYLFIRAQIQGYWIITTTGSGPQQAEYDLSFGYDHLLVFAVFFCTAFREKKWWYLALCGVSLVEILMGGSRGPLIGIGVLCVLTVAFYFSGFPKRVKIAILSMIGAGLLLLLIFGLQGIFGFLNTVLESMGISSRTIAMMAEGTITSDNGRARLWGIATDMIKNGFWGYGAYGDRQTVGQIYWVGYVHNVFLETVINYGWIVGGLLCIWMVYISVRMLFFARNETWRELFLVFFIPSTKLLLSGSFWFLDAFWACFGVYITYRLWQMQNNIPDPLFDWVSGKWKSICKRIDCGRS